MTVSSHPFAKALVLVSWALFLPGSFVVAQRAETYYEVSPAVDSIVLVQGSSKRLKFTYDIPELLVENPEIVQATPMRIDEIMVSGLRPGFTSLTVSDASNQLHTINLIVEIDTRPVELALRRNFPDSNIQVNALQTGIVLRGEVARPEQIEVARMVAQDYFSSNVISLLQVQGAQNIAIQVKVYEVSRTKLRRLGVDWRIDNENFNFVSAVSQLIGNGGVTPVAGSADFSGGIFSDSTSFTFFMQALEQRNVAKIIDQPVLIAQNGRPAEFLSGGEVPFLIQQGLGNNTFEFRPFGTKLDIVPIVEGQGVLTLEVRAEVSQLAEDLGGDTGLPGFRVRRVNTGVKMRAGHTLALAGDFRETVNSQSRGFPALMDRPILGFPFRRVQDEFNETELVFLMTPNFISDVDPTMVPANLPAVTSTLPSDRELYLNNHIEVPRCVDDCPVDQNLGGPIMQQHVPGIHVPGVQPGVVNPAGQPIIPTEGQGFEGGQVRPDDQGRSTIRQAKQTSGGFGWPSSKRR